MTLVTIMAYLVCFLLSIFHKSALNGTVSAHLHFAIPVIRYSVKHTLDYTMTSADFSLFVVITANETFQFFLVYLPYLHIWVTVTFRTSLPFASLSSIYALYQISVHQTMISLSLLLASSSQY